jgi:hypothetical protein
MRTGYDVVLCYLDMSETSGWDVARKTSEFASSPVFFIVTDGIAQARSAIPPNVNVSAILSKPIGLADNRSPRCGRESEELSALFHTKIGWTLVCSKVDRKDAFDWIKSFDR